MSLTSMPADVRNVVLVHGGFVDGSGWEGVYDALKKDGYTVTIVQNPTTSLADDVAATKRVIAAQDGPVVLVGDSGDRRTSLFTPSWSPASSSLPRPIPRS